jgi:hypothetical protein
MVRDDVYGSDRIPSITYSISEARCRCINRDNGRPVQRDYSDFIMKKEPDYTYATLFKVIEAECLE